MARPKSLEPAPQKVTVNLPAALLKRLDERAQAERRSRSNAVVLFLERGLDQADQDERARTAG